MAKFFKKNKKQDVLHSIWALFKNPLGSLSSKKVEKKNPSNDFHFDFALKRSLKHLGDYDESKEQFIFNLVDRIQKIKNFQSENSPFSSAFIFKQVSKEILEEEPGMMHDEKTLQSKRLLILKVIQKEQFISEVFNIIQRMPEFQAYEKKFHSSFSIETVMKAVEKECKDDLSKEESFLISNLVKDLRFIYQADQTIQKIADSSMEDIKKELEKNWLILSLFIDDKSLRIIVEKIRNEKDLESNQGESAAHLQNPLASRNSSREHGLSSEEHKILGAGIACILAAPLLLKSTSHNLFEAIKKSIERAYNAVGDTGSAFIHAVGDTQAAHAIGNGLTKVFRKGSELTHTIEKEAIKLTQRISSVKPALFSKSCKKGERHDKGASGDLSDKEAKDRITTIEMF